MKQSESLVLLQDLVGQGFQARPFFIMATSILLTIMLFFFLKRRMGDAAIIDGGRSGSLDVPTGSTSGPMIQRGPTDGRARLQREDKLPVVLSDVPEAAPIQNIPQDSILRRHYLAHIKYMIETVTFPCPSDSVLRRHYEQLVASELDSCLGDAWHLNGLIRRYEEQNRRA